MPEEVPISTTTPVLAPKRFVLKRASDLAYGDESRFKVKYDQELNAAQLEAVKHVNGPALVIAGAGTGKTRTLTYRVARLVEMGVDPKSILLLTFTRRAAQEMLRRAGALLHDRSAENVAGGTFHSFANLTLRHYASLIGFNNSFSILDQGDSYDAINLLRTQMGLATARRRFPRKTTLGAMFSLAVNKLISLEEVVEQEFPHFIDDLPDILRLGNAYHAYKRKSNAMDYDDLLTNLVLLLETGGGGATRHAGKSGSQKRNIADADGIAARILYHYERVALLANVGLSGIDGTYKRLKRLPHPGNIHAKEDGRIARQRAIDSAEMEAEHLCLRAIAIGLIHDFFVQNSVRWQDGIACIQ